MPHVARITDVDVTTQSWFGLAVGVDGLTWVMAIQTSQLHPTTHHKPYVTVAMYTDPCTTCQSRDGLQSGTSIAPGRPGVQDS